MSEEFMLIVQIVGILGIAVLGLVCELSWRVGGK